MTNALQRKMRTAEPASQSEVLIVRSEKLKEKTRTMLFWNMVLT